MVHPPPPKLGSLQSSQLHPCPALPCRLLVKLCPSSSLQHTLRDHTHVIPPYPLPLCPVFHLIQIVYPPTSKLPRGTRTPAWGFFFTEHASVDLPYLIHMPTDAQLLAALLAYRLANSAVVCTYFNPDEFWQSLEVAHQLVFGCARGRASRSHFARPELSSSQVWTSDLGVEARHSQLPASFAVRCRVQDPRFDRLRRSRERCMSKSCCWAYDLQLVLRRCWRRGCSRRRWPHSPTGTHSNLRVP